MSLVDLVRQAGVVGAGGGGFPTHVKLSGKADTVIINGAECEPLMHKDVVLMERRAAEMIRGLLLSMKAVGATEGIIGVKEKNSEAVEAVRAAIQGHPLRLHLLADYYPAGDEYDLVFECTGRLIPPGGIPLQVGAVVSNVETFINIAAAAEGRPVLEKTLTVAGAVRHPLTMTVPLGTPLRACIEAAGGATVDDPVLCLGGMMMGETTDRLDRPVTKTTGGLIVLPRTHPVIERKLKPVEVKNSIGKSACDQCRFCTELCPRFLLGYAVEPHQVMRSLVFTASGAQQWNEWAAMCCSCGLCTLYACPEALYPKEACDQSKVALRKDNIPYAGPKTATPHPMRDGRRVPIKLLKRRLALEDYDKPSHWSDTAPKSAQLRIPLRQGAGAPGLPLVKPGDRVRQGQPLTSLPDKTLGALVHAPADATVASVDEQAVTLTLN
jgi:Na+-translocating ferredoxin:NAD+ oxidoreductase RnfC subunit